MTSPFTRDSLLITIQTPRLLSIAMLLELRSVSTLGRGTMRWITVGAVDRRDTSIALEPVAAQLGVTDSERQAIGKMMAKGNYARVLLATKDLNRTFEHMRSTGAEIAQELTEQPMGRVIAPSAIQRATLFA